LRFLGFQRIAQSFIKVIILIASCAWFSLWYFGFFKKDEDVFASNEARFRAEMKANLERGNHEFTILADNAHFLSSQLSTLIIRIDPTELNHVIEQRKIYRNPPVGQATSSKFKAPFHFDCAVEQRLMRAPDLFIIRENCDRDARGQPK
jgi:hypothetical protein